MATTDIEDPRLHGLTAQRRAPVAPRSDTLGRSLFVFHVLIGTYLIFGWLAPFAMALAFYMVVLPIIAMQWLINQVPASLNNLETWLRHGRWRDPRNPEEASWLLMLAHWLFRWRPSRATLDALSYAAVAGLWVLAFAHFSLLRPVRDIALEP